MAQIEYVEDALSELMSLYLWDDIEIPWQDYTILSSLASAVSSEGALTKKQSRLLLKIFDRYRDKITKINLAPFVDNPKWRYDFRKLDPTKAVWIEKDEEGTIFIVLKFPYDLLKEFEEAIDNNNKMIWDKERKIKKLNLYDYNIVSIDNFVRKNNFDIDKSFADIVSTVEEIWQQQESIKPCSKVVNGQVVLINSNLYADEYFQQNSTGDTDKDMFLAKSMGFPVELEHKPTSVIEKIVQDERTHFWLKTNREFLQLYQTVDGVAAIVLDRNTKDVVSWLQKFVDDARDLEVDTGLFRVCFREPKDSSTNLNEWIAENNLGGKLEGARLYIFRHAPAKWLFKNDVDVKIVATNSYTPVNNTTTMHWTQSHHCVCHITDIKPTKTRNRQIANL